MLFNRLIGNVPIIESYLSND